MTKVLIAEDAAFIADLYKANLESEGMSVSVAKDGKDAIKRLQKAAPDVMLLDLLMPEVDGFAVLEWMKERKGPRIPVVVLTNLSQKMSQKRCKELGAADFVVKSDVEVEELMAIIRRCIAKKA